MLSPYDACVARAICVGESYLCLNQDPDGCWRDYALKPGPSEGWTTAFVGLCLGSPPTGVRHRAALQHAAKILRALQLGGGWGYNRYSTTDADSTACAIRFLSALGRVAGGPAMLRRFLDDEGRAHTFMEAGAGQWGAAHDDVTPMVGLALLAAAGERELISKIRGSVLRSRTSSGVWRSYWWATEAYATAQSLEFLEASGGIPADVATTTLDWLGALVPQSSFELALAVDICCRLQRAELARALVDRILDLQDSNGKWPPSPMLLVPDQGGDVVTEAAAHADHLALMSTAAVVRSLKRTLLTSGQCAKGLAGDV